MTTHHQDRKTAMTVQTPRTKTTGTMAQTKNCHVKFKAVGEADGLDEGVFTAYASIFGNVDSYGDKVVKGAFATTLKEWEDSGDPIPVYWSHLMGSDPDFNLGEVLEATEDETGLLVKAKLDIENNPVAAKVYRLIKGRRVRQMSFAYDVVNPPQVDEKDDSFLLTELKLHEISIVPIGANQETAILDVKVRGKAGKVLSAKNLTALREAVTVIQGVIAEAEAADDSDDSQANGSAGGKGKAGSSGKPEDRPPAPSADDDLDAQILLIDVEGL